MPQILLTGQLIEKPTYRVLCLYSSFVHGCNSRVEPTPIQNAAEHVRQVSCATHRVFGFSSLVETMPFRLSLVLRASIQRRGSILTWTVILSVYTIAEVKLLNSPFLRSSLDL
jgi:hypothetical protein